MDRSNMTGIVVEVGPATIRGPNHADAEWVSAGINGIDDELTLIDECPVAVEDVWQAVMRDVVGGRAETIVLVCSTWWASSRVDRVREAALTVAKDCVVLQRAQALREGLPDRLTTVVEIAQEFVVVSLPGGDTQVAARGDTEAIAATIPMSTAVLLDGPEGVEGAARLVAALADRLRTNGVAVTVADRDWLRRRGDALPSREDDHAQPCSVGYRGRRATAALAGTLLSAAALCGGFAARQDVPRSGVSMPMTLLVEGRVGVMVPAQWVVERVTSGPGSARVQVVSPTDADMAMHVTQSSLPPHSSHEQVAESLRSALRLEPDGAFVDFNPEDRRAERPVVTYREIRADRHISWAVVIDESLRIAIGCQSAPGREGTVRDVCDQAIRSAHAVF
jgi:type VII secretion-associated protein (TIGR03931 family)